MNSLYSSVTQLFYQLSNAFFWPVAIALLCLFAVSIADLGALFMQMWRKSRARKTDLPGVARALAHGAERSNGSFRHGLLDGVSLSPSLARFWNRLETRIEEVDSTEHIDIWLEETLQREEMEVTNRLDRTRAFVRLGPMLGLAGTIIPLGPALQSLLGGDMAGMVNHLVIGFGAVVCGLVLSGIAYAFTLVRERWARIELKEMENLCELVVRALQQASSKEAYYARISKT